MATYSHASRATSVSPSPSMTAAAMRMTAQTARVAQTSVVLNACWVSPGSRRRMLARGASAVRAGAVAPALRAVIDFPPQGSGSGYPTRVPDPGAGKRRYPAAPVIDFELTDEQRLIRDTARDFADREIIPVARDNDRNERFDLDLVKKLGDIGYLGPIVSEEYGGRGLDYRTYALVVEEVGRGDSSARTVVSVQTSLVCSSIERWGSEEQKHEWLPRLCSGEILGCFGLTEPDTGSDSANLKTRAEKTGDGWRISGQKQWISMGNYAKVALVFAQTDPEQKHRGLAAFLVPTDSDGFSSSSIHGK